ncbi:MAG: protoporphyrinogen oxidase HemJ [Pelagibacterales bacterium]|nr:protoporphyrinogen oxidase HemJ [Pelagibacterales bacterium]
MADIEFYEIAKIIHIIAVICWMAGLLYLPRIFVYHTQVEKNGETDKIFQIMEVKLLRFIMNPAMIIVFVFGLYLAYEFGFDAKWIHIKIALVLLLAGFHGFIAKCRKNFALGQNKYSQKFFRLINEIPIVLAIVIVTLVILKP